MNDVQLDFNPDPKKCSRGKLSLKYMAIKDFNSLRIHATIYTSPFNSAPAPQWKKFYDNTIDICRYFQRERAGDIFSKYFMSLLRKYVQKMPKRCPILMVRENL